MKKDKLIINPKTKVLQLIESYPELEKLIIEYLPAYGKLKDPKIRKTVAKVATLQQAASIGKVKVEELINHLRKEEKSLLSLVIILDRNKRQVD